MENLLNKLLLGKSMAQDTQKLYDALQNSNCAYELFYLIFNSSKTNIRQYAAIVLRKHFTSEENWQKYSAEQQLDFKESTLQATFVEKETLILCALARLLAKMLQRSNNDPWSIKVFNVLWQNLTLTDPVLVENASLVFVILVENMPELFIPHIKKVCSMNYEILSAAEACGDRVTKTTLNILNGVSKLVFYMSEKDVPKVFQAALPILFAMLNAYSKSNDDEDSESLGVVFDIFEDFNSGAGAILTPHLKRLVEFCLTVSFNTELEDSTRSRTIYALCWLVQENLTAMQCLNIVLPTVKGVFELIVNCAKEEIENDIVTDDDDSSTLSAACDAMDTFTNQIPSSDLYPVLMDLIKSSMQSEEEGFRRAALIVLAVTVEGLASIIKQCKHEAFWVNMIKTGVYDPSVYVRCASFFALGQCTEHLQPDILKYSKDIMPVLLEFLNTRCSNVKKSDTERKYVGLIFYALNYFCTSLNYNELEPYLPTLMTKLFECAGPSVSAKNFREMAFESIRVVIRKAGEQIVPYMGQIIALLQPYLGKYCPAIDKELRTSAICTLEDLALAVGKENFQPLIDDSIQLILMMLEDLEDDEEEISTIFSFTTAIANLYNEKAVLFLHKVVECIFDVGLVRNTPALDSDNMEIDYEEYSDEDNEQDMTSNQLLCESMNTLANFSKCCTLEFKPYLRSSFDKCYMLMSDHSETVRQSAVDSCTEILTELVKCEDSELSEIKEGLNRFAFKAMEIIVKEKKLATGVVLVNALQNYVTSYSKIGKLDEKVIDHIVDIIINGLKGELNCQVEFYMDNGNHSDKLYDLALQTAVTTLLCNLSTYITLEEFLVCFEKICPVLLDGLESADGNHEWLDDRKAISIYCMGSCITALGKSSAKYYNVIFNLLFNGLRSESSYIQNDAMCGIGELVYQAGPCSYSSFPYILKELSRLAQEGHSDTIEMVCCTLARLILTNRTLVPVTEVLPIIVNNAPLKEHVRENLVLFESLKMLYVEERELVLHYFSEIVTRGLDLIDKVKRKIIVEECHLTAFELVHELRNTYQEQFQMVLTEHPELNKIINCE